MNIRNTSSTYGSIAKWLHWLTAFLFLLTYAVIYYRQWFASNERESWITIQLHFSIGLSLAVMIFLRICWRLMDKPPKPSETIPSFIMYKRITHALLYLAMVIMPISGYLSKVDYFICGNGNISFYFLYDLSIEVNPPLCVSFGATLEALSQPAEIVHELAGNWLILPLISLHIAAALYHHFVLMDDTLSKITIAKIKL